MKIKAVLLGALYLAAFMLLLYASNAQAAGGDIEVKATAQVEITTTDAKGKKETKLVDATMAKVLPDTEVFYTITYTNKGKNPAKDVVVDNPIAKEMSYTGGSASGEGTDITFSIDNGKTFNTPSLLKVKGKDGKEKEAPASDYTNIRWTIKSVVQPGKGGTVKFRAKVR